MTLKIRLCLAVSLLAGVLVGCNTKQEVAPKFTFTTESAAILSSGISAPATETKVQISFTSATSWMATAENAAGEHASWIVIYPAAGTGGSEEITVTVTVVENPSLEARSAVVTFSSGELTQSLQVTQAARAKQGITELLLSDTELEITEGESATIIATVLPTYADGDKTVSWSSSAPDVATVEDGLVKAIKPGTAVITATVGSLSASCTVTVHEKAPDPVPVESITLDKEELTLTEGETAQLIATVLPENADDKTVSWSSSDPSVATVTSTGIVVAVKAGTAVITAKAGDNKIATCTVTVERDMSDGSTGEDLDDDIDVDPWN